MFLLRTVRNGHRSKEANNCYGSFTNIWVVRNQPYERRVHLVRLSCIYFILAHTQTRYTWFWDCALFSFFRNSSYVFARWLDSWLVSVTLKTSALTCWHDTFLRTFVFVSNSEASFFISPHQFIPRYRNYYLRTFW